jgi:GNAT superfamily N-acetyltransferase
MAVTTYDVAKMRAGEEPAVIGALARAFYDDPLFGFFLPNHVRQSRALLAFMGANLKDARTFDETWVARREGKVASAAVWLPPGTYPRSARREMATLLRTTPTFVAAGRRVLASLRLLAALDRAHHHTVDGPHWYLEILGSDPSFQRTGAGSAALEPVLSRCDTEGLPAYLETQKRENIAYYARHKFELVQQIDVRGVPPLWTLLREPR